VADFSSLKSDRQLTSFHQQSTTNSPSKNHVLHPVFAKTPSKNELHQPRKKLLRKRPFFGQAGTQGADEIGDVVVEEDAGEDVLRCADGHGDLEEAGVAL
jgi:hypothetical protein